VRIYGRRRDRSGVKGPARVQIKKKEPVNAQINQ
jgi:hypothetical protein